MDAFLAAETPTFRPHPEQAAWPIPPWREPQPAIETAVETAEIEPSELPVAAPRKYYLPKRKLDEAESTVGASPKMLPKPYDTETVKRAVGTRTAEDRDQHRAAASSEDDPNLPWDSRGPRGPQDGGPETWRGQRFRPNTGRWANAGGAHRDKYALYHAKKRLGLIGKELAFWHPMTKGGHWEQVAHREGKPSPREMKLM